MESFTGTLQDGLSYEVLTNLTAWNDSLTSSYVLYTWHFAGYSSCELVMNCTESSLKLNSSPISHNHSLQFVGNEGIYSVGKEFGKTLYLFAKQKVLQVPRGMALLAKHS